MEREPVTLSIIEMDEQVRETISHARDQLEDDAESLARLNELVSSWTESCYQLMMSYNGLSLMKFIRAENAQSMLDMAQSIIPRNSSRGKCVFVD